MFKIVERICNLNSCKRLVWRYTRIQKDSLNFSKEIYLSLMNELSLWLFTSNILEQSIGVRVKEMIVEKKIAPIIVTASSSNNFAVSPFKKTTGMKILINTTEVDIIAKKDIHPSLHQMINWRPGKWWWRWGREVVKLNVYQF